MRLRHLINLDEAAAFIKTLTGKEDTICDWRIFHPHKDSTALNKRSTLQDAAEWLIEHNVKGYGVYMTIQESDGKYTPPKQGASSDNIVSARALFVESDKGPFPAELPLKPSIRAMSGSGEHIYWVLSDHVAAADIKGLQVALINALGADPNPKDAARVMRVPGFLWTKPEDPNQWKRMYIVDVNDGTHTRAEIINKVVGSRPQLTAELIRAEVDNQAAYLAAVTEGRNNALNTAAFYLKDLVALHPELTDYAHNALRQSAKVAGSQGAPPLSDEEIEGTLRSGWFSSNKCPRAEEWLHRFDVFGDRRPWKNDAHSTIAKGIIDDIGTENFVVVKHKRGSGLPYKFLGDVWEPIYSLEALVLGYIGYPIQRKKGAEPLAFSESMLRGVCRIMLSYPGQLRPSNWFQQGVGYHGVCFQDGWLGLDPDNNYEFYGGVAQRDDRFLWRFEETVDEDAPCDKWVGFLDAIWADLSFEHREQQKALLGAWMGIMLMGQSAGEDAMLTLLGASGANGKSTLMRIIKDLLPGDLVVNVPPQNFKDETYRAALAPPVRLNLVAELPDKTLMDSPSFKSVISGDPISGRLMRENPFWFEPQAGHLVAANSLPHITDDTDAFWRRIKILTFSRVFDGKVKSRNLVKSVLSQRTGIIVWALEHAQAALRAGELPFSELSERARQEWRMDTDHLQEYFTENYMEDTSWDSGGINADELLVKLTATLRSRNYHPVSMQKMGRWLANRGIEKRRIKGKTHYALKQLQQPGVN